MGTITRSFANNITTSGVFTSSAFNNDSFDNVTSVPSGAIESGAMVLVSTATASASASIEFSLGSYKEYKFYFVNMHPSTVSDFDFQVSINNGSSYGVNMTTTWFQAAHNEADTVTGLSYQTGEDLAQSTSFQTLNQDMNADNDASNSGYLHLFNPSSTTYVKHFIAVNQCMQSAPFSVQGFCAGYVNTTSALTNIKFQMSSGNIDAGKILMFGIN